MSSDTCSEQYSFHRIQETREGVIYTVFWPAFGYICRQSHLDSLYAGYSEPLLELRWRSAYGLYSTWVLNSAQCVCGFYCGVFISGEKLKTRVLTSAQCACRVLFPGKNENTGISSISVSITWAIFLGEKENLLPPLPHPQHLADGLPDHLVRGGLMDWYLDIGTLPVSGVRY